MPKLYPPIVDNTIPAFTGNTIAVPFKLNKAVSKSQIKSMKMIIKTVQNNVVIGNGINGTQTEYYSNYIAQFSIDGTKIHPGQYYKVQIAFVDYDGQTGYYSPVSVIKYTSSPEIFIEGLKTNVDNLSKYIYVGHYTQNNPNSSIHDLTEKVYSYRFQIIDCETKKIFDDSGLLIHNNSADTENDSSIDIWTTSKRLLIDRKYQITYTVNTVNGLTVTTPSYNLYYTEIKPSEKFKTQLVATLHEEDAYVDIHLVPNSKDKTNISGNFILVRASSKDNFESWYEIYRFSLTNTYPSIHIWDDHTVEQGQEYRYALQAYNENQVYTSHFPAINFLCEADEKNNFPVEKLIIEFEDAFLYDGRKQLKIRYNPKVSSFKTVILESKVNTLGGKYPYIFRNGDIEYKEFPISGLISLLSDPNEHFTEIPIYSHSIRNQTFSREKNIRTDTITSLSRDNVYAERQFKLEVLDWLSNGEPKLFRSPGEGNYIIRLMNVSLTPIDAVSRMLHSFNCTAYEIAEYNFENLLRYNFAIQPGHQTEFRDYRSILPKEFRFDSREENKETKIGMLKLADIFKDKNTFSFSAWSGAFFLAFDNQESDLIIKLSFINPNSEESFNIFNSSGRYVIPPEILQHNPVLSMSIILGTPSQDATVTFGYYETEESKIAYSVINDIKLSEEIRQISGKKNSENKNLIDDFTDLRKRPGRFKQIKILPKKLYSIYSKNGKYYEDFEFKFPYNDWSNIALYYDHTVKKYYCGKPSPETQLEGRPKYIFKLNSDDYSNLLDEDDNIPTSGRFESINNIDEVKTLVIGDGVYCEVVYVLRTILFTVETSSYKSIYPNLFKKKDEWIKDKNIYEKALQEDFPAQNESYLFNKMNQSYKTYLTQLEKNIIDDSEKGESIYAL